MRRIRQHLTYSNVMVTILAFIVLTGGTAVALQGTNTVFTDDIANDTQPASGGNPAGGLQAADLRPGSVGTSEVANNSLTGADIRDRSGVDTCVRGARLGEFCFRAENDPRPWVEAAAHCANLNLRLPTYAEAKQLARNYDLPNVNENEFFWTDEIVTGDHTFDQWAFTETDAGPTTRSIAFIGPNAEVETACVATPTN